MRRFEVDKDVLVHNCDRSINNKASSWYHEDSNTWWLELNWDTCIVTHCPFCGVELRELVKDKSDGDEIKAKDYVVKYLLVRRIDLNRTINYASQIGGFGACVDDMLSELQLVSDAIRILQR